MTIAAAKTNKIEIEGITEIQTDESEDTASPEEAKDEIVRTLQENKDFFLRLVHYAEKKIKYLYKGGNISGHTGMDIVQMTLERIIKGKRKWNRQKIPRIESFLHLAVFSVIRDEHNKAKKFATLDMYDADGRFDENRFPEFIKECYAHDFSKKLFEDDFEQLLTMLQKDIETDIDGYFVLEEILKGNDSNISIADKLGIEIKDVVNAKKRIKNKTKLFLKKVK